MTDIRKTTEADFIPFCVAEGYAVRHGIMRRMPNLSLHRPPRRPHGWAWGLLAVLLAATAVGWRSGWLIGLGAFLVLLAPFWWATLVPDSRLFSPVLRRLPGDARRVWLTIDDGPSVDTQAMLDLLDAHAAKATFFVVGVRAQAQPELLREIVRRGHGVGNHSATHPQAWFWALPPWRIRAEIVQAQATLREIAGVTPRWFRAVVGMANPFVAAVLKDQRLARVAWSARGFDAVSADPQAVASRIESQLQPGAIVLLHEGAKHGRNVEALALVLQRLDALEYRCVLPEDVEAEAADVARHPREGGDPATLLS